MKNSIRHQLFAVLLLCLGTLAAAQQGRPVTTVTAPATGATISDFKGKVSIQLPGQALLSPTRGQVLPPDSTVTTDDGRLLLHLSDGSDILVRPHTKLTIKDPASSGWHSLDLTIGKVRSHIEKHLQGTPPFQIGTPSAVISVRGTRFDVEVNRLGFTEVDVDEGVVELDSLTGRGEAVMITAGFSSRVGMDSAPEVPRPTRELRPQLDRPSTKDDRDPGDDDAIRRLASSNRGPGDGSGGGGISGGSGDSGSGGGDRSGSSGGSSGSDGGSSGSSGGSSGSDDGSRVSGSGSDGGSSVSGSSGSSGGSSTSGSSGSSGDGGSSGSGSGDHGDHHGGKPPEI